MKLLAFDIWGDFAHFRKFYTTSSPLSFSFPPPPTIAGILGAIYGANKFSNEYLKLFLGDDCFLSVQIVSNVMKLRLGINLVETKGSNLRRPFTDKNLAPRTQVRTEFLRSPKYRIYFFHKNEEVYNRILDLVSNHKTFFTVSLGLSELIANFEFCGEFEFENDHCKEGEYVEVLTPVISSNLNSVNEPIIYEEGKKYFREKIPLKMEPDRLVTNYADVIFTPDGSSIKASLKVYQKIENGANITFF